jgi:hypothetical protein
MPWLSDEIPDWDELSEDEREAYRAALRISGWRSLRTTGRILTTMTTASSGAVRRRSTAQHPASPVPWFRGFMG